MTSETEVLEAFPSLAEIDDQELREQIVSVWISTVDASAYDSLEEAPWWPPEQDSLDEWKSSASHIRDVAGLSVTFADVLSERFDADIDRDLVVAGALLHDISKFHELAGDELTELHDWLPHPHYGVHVVAKAGLSEHLQHIVLSHTARSAVEPQSIEAQIVATADRMAVHGLFQEQTDDLAPF